LGEYESPLIHSGLVLAGANRRASLAAGAEDGILTAEEVASLDLHGVEWVVLSACETGIGEVRRGEGVFGLRRAFEVSGARTLIMSLWSVDDQTTAHWMRSLYSSRLGDGMGTAEAIRAVQIQWLQQVRASGSSTHPFAWGAFVAVGDWR
jgi:CHAT domain-containing protein